MENTGGLAHSLMRKHRRFKSAGRTILFIVSPAELEEMSLHSQSSTINAMQTRR